MSRSRKRPAADGVIVRPRARSLLLGGLITLALGAGVLVYAIEQVGVMPRTLAPYIERRASGHNPTIVQTGSLLSRTLLTLDRGPSHGAVAGLPSSLGVRPEPAGVIGAPGLTVTTPDELRAALARVEPGTTVTLLPGTYRERGRALDANRPGRADANDVEARRIVDGTRMCTSLPTRSKPCCMTAQPPVSMLCPPP